MKPKVERSRVRTPAKRKEWHISFAWAALTRGKFEVRAMLDDTRIHCDEFKITNAKDRNRFLREVIKRLPEDKRIEITPDQLEPGLLKILEDVGREQMPVNSAMDGKYRIVEVGDESESAGMYLVGPDGLTQLTNAVIRLDRDVTTQDGRQKRRRFEGTVSINGVESRFTISAEDFGIGSKILSAIFSAAGPAVIIHCRGEVLGRAISATSRATQTSTTTDSGWEVLGSIYRSSSVRIDTNGVHPVGEDDPIRVDLSEEQCARRLGLLVPGPGELEPLRRHFAQDFLGLQERSVMFTVMAAAALGVLYRFVGDMNRPVIWLAGLTGGGKSFVARLAQSLFGDFPLDQGADVGSWSSTTNFTQRQGYFFRDAVFLVDDFKPDLTRHAEAIRLLQNYADGSARGRLNSDATTNLSREIRAILLCTGEAIPEQSPSSLARTVVIQVNSLEKDLDRGERCRAFRHRYPALMADFIHWLIVNDRGSIFARRVASLQKSYYEPIAGSQNDSRIAGNLALIGAAAEEFGSYLAITCPDMTSKIQHYIERDLPSTRDAIVDSVREQQASEIFLEILGSLIDQKRVKIEGWVQHQSVTNMPLIGKIVKSKVSHPVMLDINVTAALEVVQESLRKQNRPHLAVSPRTLLDQLAGDRRLLDSQGRPILPGSRGKKTKDAKIGGTTRKTFRLTAETLFGPDSSRFDPTRNPDSRGG